MKKYILFLGVLIVFGCSEKQKADVSKEKMINILTELTLASSARSISNNRDSVQYIVSYESILKKYGLDSLEFAKAQHAYQQDPDVYAVIYDSVHNRLQKKVEEIRASKIDSTEEKINPVISIKDVPFSRRKINN